MADILQFKKIEEKDKEQVGLKAYNLSLIKEYSNVPNGFVLSKDLMRKFLEENNLVEIIQRFLSSLMINNENIIPIVNLIQKKIIDSKFSEEFKEEILEFYESLAFSKGQDANQMLDKPKKPLVCVRNGEWTEESDNIYQLNVIGDEKLLESIKLAFASNFTSKRIILKKESGKSNEQIFEDSINPVIVQLMQQVQRSGISISLNPSNNSEKEILIRASFGLGIAKDDPNLEYDEYTLNEDYELIDSTIGNQQYAYEKDIESDTTVKYMLKENSTKEKLNSVHLKEIGKITKKLTRILESNMIIEWGFNKDKLIIFDAKPIELENLGEDVIEYGVEDNFDEKIEQTNVQLEEYEIPNAEHDIIETIEFSEETGNEDSFDDKIIEEHNIPEMKIEEINISESEDIPSEIDNLEIVTFDETEIIDMENPENIQYETVDLEEELEKPSLEYEEKLEEVVTLDDFDEKKEDDSKEEAEFGYNFIDERPNEEQDESDDIIVELDGNIKNEEVQEKEPDLFINMNRPMINEENIIMPESIQEDNVNDDNLAQQLLDEDFEDLDDEEIEFHDSRNDKKEINETEETDNVFIEENLKSIDLPEEPAQVKQEDNKEEPSFFDMIEEEIETSFDQPKPQEEIKEQPEFIEPMNIDEEVENDDDDFFSRMEVEEDGDFIFSNDDNEEIQKEQKIPEEKSDLKKNERMDKDVFMKKNMSNNPSLMMEKAFSEASNVVITCDAAILNSLKSKYKAMFNKEPHNYFIELINELKTKTNVPYEKEIKKVRSLREKYLSDYEALSSEEILFCLNTSKNFTNEF